VGSVSYERDEDLGIITISNPPVNAFSAEMMGGLREALVEAGESGARALLTRATGDNFCAGADVNFFVDRDYGGARAALNEGFALMSLFENVGVPTVAAVNGMCIGAGMEVMLAHDLAVAGQSARIGQVEASIGTMTLLGGAQRVAARAGVARAKEMVFTAAVYDAATLERWNIVNRVVPDDRLQDEAYALARQLANGPTLAHGATKASLNAFAQDGLAAADKVTMAAGAHLFETQDMTNGVQTFLQKGARAFAAEGVSFAGK
jgi:enoyl-CoA hydratase/carnithine racemase